MSKRFHWLLIVLLIAANCMAGAAMAATPGTLKWKLPISTASDTFHASPAIGQDGTIYAYAITDDGYLVAVNPSGTEKWRFRVGKQYMFALETSPVIGKDGTIYVGCNEGLYAVNPNGTQKWLYAKAATNTPVIGVDGTIFIAVYLASYEYRLVAFKPDGTKKWEFDLFGSSCRVPMAVADDGTIYVGTDSSNFFAVNPDGTRKWNFLLYSNTGSGPAVASDGTIYVTVQFGDILHAINPDGTEKWQYSLPQYSAFYSTSPTIGTDGTIYLGLSGGIGDPPPDVLVAVNPDGTRKWGYSGYEGMPSAPAVGADGTLYLGSRDRNFYALNSTDGSIKWQFGMDTEVKYSSPALAPDGTAYVQAFDGCLYAINTSSAGLANTPWPMFLNNVRHSGCRVDTPPSPKKVIAPIVGLLLD